MSTPPFSDYYYGNEADQYTFYRLPKVLFTNDRYKSLSDGAKILYGPMLDRMGLSMKNGWLDEQDRVFIFFTLEDVQEYMNCKQDKGIKLLAKLDAAKGVGLIERVKQRQGRPTKIYVSIYCVTVILAQITRGRRVYVEMVPEKRLKPHFCKVNNPF